MTMIETQREYNLKCKVRIKEIQVNDIGKTFTRRVCYLLPETNDQAMAFYSAWLPDTTEDYYEIPMIIGTPILSPCRGAILRGSRNCPEKHIYVMTKGVEEDFIRYKLDGQTVMVKVLSESAEEGLETKGSDGSYDLL